MALVRTYPVPPYGYAPQFSETERPATYASQLVNRFVNSGGGAEARPPLRRVAVVPGSGRAQALGEIIRARGSTRMVGVWAGKLLAFDHQTSAAAADAFVTAYDSFNSALDYFAQFVQLDDKLIAVGENDEPVWTRTGRSWQVLTPLIHQGNAQTTASAVDKLQDVDVASFVLDTDVAVNDLVLDTTTSAYALITNVGSAALTHTPLTAASPGISSGKAAKAGGDHYEIIDLVENNIVPSGGQDDDNVAVARTGTDASTVFVSAAGHPNAILDWRRTTLRVGDWLSNTTRNQVARVRSFNNSAIRITDIAGQINGDSLVFFKSAIPQASRAHVHYNRLYLVDARNKKRVSVGGPGDARDFTTFSGTLDSTLFRFGAQQPEGDEVLTLGSFQRYLMLAGKRHVLLFEGTNPIADASGDTADFKPASMFPQGVVGPEAVAPTGNDIVFLTPAGLQAASIPGSNLIPVRDVLSQALRDELARELVGVSAQAANVVHYAQRMHVMVRVSNRMWVLNYSPNLANQGAPGQPPTQRGSWSTYTGAIANQRVYHVRSTGTLWTSDASGGLWRFDDPAQTADNPGSAFATRMQTAWLGMDEGRGGLASRKRKAGVALMPTFQLPASHPGATYRITVSAPYENQGGESKSVSVGTAAVCGQGAFTPRLPFRWSGERARLTIESTARQSAVGPDVVGAFTFEYNERGVGR